MFVVLGVIIVITMLGFLGLNLAKHDNDEAGNVFNMKSQRIVAISGLNLAAARIQQKPTVTLAILKAFIADPTKSWVVISSSGDPVTVQSSEPDWFALSATPDQSAIKIQIIGLGSGLVNEGLPIYLRSLGRGRDGEVYEARGVYLARGLDYTNVYPTNGPTDAILARGGIENADAGLNVDGGIYSGGTGTTKLQAKGATASFSRVRIRGDLEIYSSAAAPVTVVGNSIIGGLLKIGGGGVAKFGANLVTGYAYSSSSALSHGVGPIDGSLEVAKSLYVWGVTSPSPINKDITVGENIWFRDMPLDFAGKMRVGKSGTSTINAWFDRGIQTNGAVVEVNGRMDVGSRKNSDDNKIGGWVTVRGDLNFYQTNAGEYSHIAINAGSLMAEQDLASYWSIATDNNAPSPSVPSYLSWSTNGAAPCLKVKGQSWLGNGIKNIDRNGSEDTAGMVFLGGVYLNRTSAASGGGQETFANGAARFQSSLVMNGSLASAFGSTAGKKRWFFIGTSTPSWSYNGAEAYKNTITNVTGTWRSTDVDFSAHPLDIVPAKETPPTLTSLGYSAAEQDLTLANNPASEVFVSRMGATYTNSEYENIYSKYKDACKLNEFVYASGATGTGDDYPPNASQLACIYNKEVATSGSFLWNKQYLVIKIANSGKNRFNNLNQLSSAQRILPAGVKIFWIIEIPRNINGCWYSGQRGSVQILQSSSKLTDFGWDGDFYGFIQLAGDYDYLRSYGSKFNLYGAIEISSTAFTGQSGSGIRINAGTGLNVFRNDAATQTVFSDIVGSFFSSDGVGTGTDKWIIRFNGDKSQTNSTKTSVLVLKDGWVQMERLGEYR